MNRIIFILIVFLICVSEYSFAQTDNEKPTIKVIVKSDKSNVKLRWAPDNSISWQLLNKYGYRLERITTFRNGKLLRKGEKVILEDKILPQEKEEWTNVFNKDTTDQYIAIAAQALYGGEFKLDADAYSKDGLAQLIHTVKEREARYSYTLFSADQSSNAAYLSGLYYEDKTVKLGEKYLYRIHSLVPDSIEQIQYGKVLATVKNEHYELPQPERFAANYKEGKVTLTWDWLMLSDVYNSYWVQKSEDGVNYYDVTKTPFIQPSKDEPSPNMIFMDSIGNQEGTYYYRIKGKDAFGEWGPYVNPIRIEAYPVMEFTPELKVFEDHKSGSVLLKWEIDEGKALGVKSLLLARAETDKEKDFFILKEDIPVKTGEYLDIGPEISNYYKLGAKDKVGKVNWSYVEFIQLTDSVPPSIPENLAGEVDSLGRVQITWEPSPERDVFGYRLYRANKKDGVYIQITKKEIPYTNFEDSISIKTLAKNVYYKVLSVDKRGNPSELSEALQLKRPDVIPPSPPVISYTKSTIEGPYLEWYPSGSNDVAYYLLYRKGNSEVERWELIKEYGVVEGKQSFLDSSVVDHQTYHYLMIAIDDSNLESIPTKPVGIRKFDTKVRKGIEKLALSRGEKGVQLSWVDPISGNYSIDIYRSFEEEPLRFYARVEKGSETWEDISVNDGGKYKYRLKVNYEDGASSKLSEPKQIKY
ncbi:fibronectin type III domain-containing protein [Flammeovirga sp. SJP92]|uniref:fibronectin type III domain-containing protein n=1 Tax=Flammeovirga sp. SJP92 TaxID=1775430 RepID=UPI000787805D|nr:hypothetical protein [Flammeovirga sp. SJP92]KXX66997.1 hypothetical protein AVL50_28910 [Flammeovirga sp. SJP92]